MAADIASAPYALPLNEAPPAFYRFYAHIGVVGVFADVDAKIKAAGTVIPGSKMSVPATVAPALELGYRVTPNWAVSLSGGIPPTSILNAGGSIAAEGKLGSTVAAAPTLTLHYHFLQLGAFQPYIGGGGSYLIVFNSRDGSLSHLRVDGAFGVLGQVGTDIMLSERVGLFVDLKKGILHTNARGAFGPVPIKTSVALDPLALTGGVTIRF
ncbi:OmpW/AlkL family protein [Lichenifustis flavocetrariae]|uniref:Outer membrane protein n=1 Tax=Lichenifustis flavocetrariae TaxID=2949735 RepID=A0AA42CHD0_9HYPH|nr:OmpW family outer membrane protein [Lichenifustis flavocetrariae]MCW6507144.1 hypothetical protein [Lichenifustis flavocetrariae]